MTVEEKLRSVMRAHDAEAPTRVPWPVPASTPLPRRRPPARVVLVAAVVALLVAGGTWLAVAWPRNTHRAAPAVPPAPLACPAQWEGQFQGAGSGYEVPSRATTTGAADRLVPDATPTAVVVCGYAQASPTLTGSQTLTGDLSAVRDALTWLPPGDPGPCIPFTPPSGPNPDRSQYLVGLTYDDGAVWVAAPGNHCDGAGNGVFRTPVNLRADAAAWLAAGHWVAPVEPIDGDPRVPSCPASPGRLGEDTALVPGTPTALTICEQAGVIGIPYAVSATRLGEVVAAVRALPTQTLAPGTIVCSSEPSYRLFFSYAAGPPATVQVSPLDGCSPDVSNGSLRAQSTPALTSLLQQLTRR